MPGPLDPDSKSPAMGKASDMPPGVLLWIVLEGCMPLQSPPETPGHTVDFGEASGEGKKSLGPCSL